MHEVYFIGQDRRIVGRVGQTKTPRGSVKSDDGKIMYYVKFSNGLYLDIPESDLFFLNRPTGEEIERLLELDELPNGLPGDWSEHYFQILKAIAWKERENAPVNPD